MSVTVTLLTGRRPDLLDRTLRALAEYDCPRPIHVFHNGGDPDTRLVLARTPIDLIVTTRTDWLNVGRAVSKLARQVEGDYWLHLEDDWEATANIPEALEQAISILTDPEIGQVRLRLRTDGASRYHNLTRRRINWQPVDGYLVGEAHATWNPALIRTSDVPKFYPAFGETDFMGRVNTHYPKVAQLEPGVFQHLGKGRSLIR